MRDPKYFYDTQVNVTDEGIRCAFISEGTSDIFKVISYTYVQDFLGRRLYNLGFGDYDLKKKAILDDVISNNGDHYRVFSTVLNTIPAFFENYPNAIMVVRGSDSTPEFVNGCKLTCKKKCSENECRNSHRRINLYRSYVDRNYDMLVKEYVFLGGPGNIDSHRDVENYEKGKKYDSVFLMKKEL
jgi:hypothetical protein